MKKFLFIPIVLILLFISTAFAQFTPEAKVGGRIAPDGTEINLDLPGSQHLRNKAGTDRAGVCTFTSAEHSGQWQGIDALIGLRDWRTKFRGGGTPTIMDEAIKQYAKERNLPVPDYLNLTGRRELLPILKKAVDNGLMPAVTYGYSPSGRYKGQRISHMVSMIHYDKNGNIGILDNNYPGVDQYEWLTEEQFYRTFTDGPGYGWCMIFLPNRNTYYGPPPFPFN